MARFYLGVDGGQSSTTALIANDNGQVLGVGRSGPCNHVTGAEARIRFLSVVGECLRQATEQAGIDGNLEFAAACLGFSGGAQDKRAYIEELIRSRHTKVTHDAEIALLGATDGQAGIVVIAGTGSIAFGRNNEGRTARAGGWGYIFGDEGGAFDIARRSLRAALRMEEGWGEATDLRERLLQTMSAPSANDLMHRFYTGIPRQQIAALAPLVDESATRGDSVATAILREAADELVRLAQGVYRTLFVAPASVPVAYIGGVFQSERLRQSFIGSVRSVLSCEAIRPHNSPAAGALLEALRLDGNTSTLKAVPEIKT